MSITRINNIFSIGYRCNSDEFLIEYLKVRKYSSPFSYMVIDIKTALEFIDRRFQYYIDHNFIQPGNTSFKFNKHKWRCNHVHKFSKITNNNVDILDMDKVCIWNHHNLKDSNTIKSIHKRSNHLLECLDNSPKSTLLFYIEKIQIFNEKEDIHKYFDKTILQKYNCNFLILVPLLNYESEPILICDDEYIKIIYFKSDLTSWSVCLHVFVNEWKKLNEMINNIYEFDIEERKENT